MSPDQGPLKLHMLKTGMRKFLLFLKSKPDWKGEFFRSTFEQGWQQWIAYYYIDRIITAESLANYGVESHHYCVKKILGLTFNVLLFRPVLCNHQSIFGALFGSSNEQHVFNIYTTKYFSWVVGSIKSDFWMKEKICDPRSYCKGFQETVINDQDNIYFRIRGGNSY